MSADGRVVVGEEASGELAVIWDEANGARDLHDVLLLAGLEESFAGWRLLTARAVSADGLTIVGTGRNPDGLREAFVVRLDEIPSPPPPPPPAEIATRGPGFWRNHPALIEELEGACMLGTLLDNATPGDPHSALEPLTARGEGPRDQLLRKLTAGWLNVALNIQIVGAAVPPEVLEMLAGAEDAWRTGSSGEIEDAIEALEAWNESGRDTHLDAGPSDPGPADEARNNDVEFEPDLGCGPAGPPGGGGGDPGSPPGGGTGPPPSGGLPPPGGGSPPAGGAPPPGGGSPAG